MARSDVPAAAAAGFALGWLRPRQRQALEKATKAVKAAKLVGVGDASKRAKTAKPSRRRKQD